MLNLNKQAGNVNSSNIPGPQPRIQEINVNQSSQISQPPPNEPKKDNIEENVQLPGKQLKIPDKSKNLPAEKNIILTSIVRSDYYSQLDRQADYDEITSLIRKEGFFGLGKINMEEIEDVIIARKAQIEGRGETEQKGLREELANRNRPKSELDDLMFKDGIFISDENTWLINLETQLQKQRMMDNPRFLQKFYKKNADLVVDQQFFDEKISRTRIVSLTPNPALAIKRRPAINCERLNQNKHDPFRLRVYIGKIILTKHHRMIQEEILIQELILKVTQYKERCDVALIPHYNRALRIIEFEIASLERLVHQQPKKQIAILENERNKLQALISEETNLMRNLITDVLDQWKLIQNMRQAQGKTYNPIKLYVKQYKNQDNGNELEFLLSKEIFSEDKEVDRSEQRRRGGIRSEQIFVELIVNGQVVGKSRTAGLEFPEFEAKIMEEFHILIFTRPKSMQLRIYQSGFINKIIDTIDLEIPGDKSRTITATAQLLSQIEFCEGANARRAEKLLEIEMGKKRILEKAKADEELRSKKKIAMEKGKKKSGKEEERKDNDAGSVGQEENNDQQELNGILSPEKAEEKRKEEERRMVAEQMQQLEEKEKKARESAMYRGNVSILCEWTGQGDRMPPQNIDNFGKGEQTSSDFVSTFENPDDTVNQILEEKEEEGFHFDVNDPRNEFDIEKLKSKKSEHQHKQAQSDFLLPFANIKSLRERLIKCSQINPEITEIPMREEEIQNNLRLKELIEKTEQGIFLLDELGEDVAKQQKKTMFLGDVAITSKEVFEHQAYSTRKRIQNIKSILLKRQKFAMIRKQNNKDGAPLTLKNVVNEYIIEENEIVIVELIKQCFTQQRKLQPKKKKEEKMRLQDIKDGINFLFHISHGTNVPLRDDQAIMKQQQHMIQNRQSRMMGPAFMGMGMGMGNGMDQPRMDNQALDPRDPRSQVVEFKNIQDLVRVNTFVRIKLIFEKQEYFIDSKPFEGNNPEWSCDRPIFLPQTLKKLSNYELFNSANQIIISLFDLKIIRKQSKTNKKKFIRTEHSFFLGSVSIPLYALFQNQKMAATFRLNRPIIIFGYYTDTSSMLGYDYNFSQIARKIRMDPLTPTTINLSVNVNPFIEIVQDNDDIFYGDNQDSRLEYYATKWMEKFKKHKEISKRNIRIWGNDIEQNSFYLPRYLTMLKPPPIFLGGELIDPKDIKNDPYAIEKVARFVSLIPFKSDTELFKDIPDIHCDSQQFLDLKGGDFEEHAFLLCNYFNYIDHYCGRKYKSYVLLGHAIPEGKTFFVLRRDEVSNNIEIWNPSTGEPFVMISETIGTKFLCCTIGKNKQSIIQRYDKNCPLYSVGCVVDHKNVYVNIQPNASPSQLDWNIENPKLWAPFLNDAQIESLYGQKGIESIYKQEDALQYEVTPLDPIKQLKMTIFSFLERRIMESRQKEVNFQPEITKFSHDRNKEELFQALESMKYKCRLSGLGTQLSDQEINQQQDNDDQNQQINNGIDNRNQGMGGGPGVGGDPQSRSHVTQKARIDNDLTRKLQSAEQTLEQIQTQIEEYVPPNKQLYGFPLNMPFTTIERVWEEIKQTGIHEILQTDIEYILDVHCFPYPNFIISVWVFIGVLYEE